ncbi:MAG TPA: 50S ribosomal protein L19, partial [Candidatus Saccharimonadales bacterium]|nr:50S ribosomal protein L19 [Candidatus Saccharimonadales bacterium]
MHPMITKLEEAHRKPAVSQVQSGDTVRVHQRIREGNKERVQVFEGVVIRTHRLGSVSATVTVRRIASGVGVEKTYLLHSP